MSRERYEFCKTLNYDVLALTELHNLQHNLKPAPDPKLWIPSATAGVHKSGPKKGKYTDPAAGVAIMISPRMKQHYRDSGHVGTRIAWFLAGPVCNIFFVAVYVPHKFRTVPNSLDIIEKIDALLATVPKNDCIIVAGDFNCQLRRHVERCTGKWAMTSRNEDNNHDQEVLDLMHHYDLFDIGTKFKP